MSVRCLIFFFYLVGAFLCCPYNLGLFKLRGMRGIWSDFKESPQKFSSIFPKTAWYAWYLSRFSRNLPKNFRVYFRKLRSMRGIQADSAKIYANLPSACVVPGRDSMDFPKILPDLRGMRILPPEFAWYLCSSATAASDSAWYVVEVYPIEAFIFDILKHFYPRKHARFLCHWTQFYILTYPV